MGFDFASPVDLIDARREFRKYLVSQGIPVEVAEKETSGLNHSWEFTTYKLPLDLHRYHLPGQHDQCDHSVTGVCVDPDWEKSPDNPVNDPRLPKPTTKATKGKLPPRTNIDDVVLIKLKSGKRVVGQADFNDPSGKNVLIELKTRKKLTIDPKDIAESWKLFRPKAPPR